MRRPAAEVLGTFALVFAGTGAVVINDVSGGTVAHAGGALPFGLVVPAIPAGRCVQEPGCCRAVASTKEVCP